MVVENVGYVFVPNYATTGKVNPYRGKQDFKPGLIFDKPEEKKDNHTGAKVLGLATAAVLAYVFRGKIKAGATDILKKAQPYAQKAYKAAANIGKKGLDLAKKGIDVVKPYAEKAIEYLKNTKVVQYFTK